MSDILTAVNTILRNQPMAQRYIDYYDGHHELAFASEKFRNAFGRTLQSMRDNLCPIVIEATADRMEVINFSGDKAKKAIANKAWSIWERNQMPIISNNLHREALKTGDAYLLIWANPLDNSAMFYEQDSRLCTVIEDEETGMPLFAAKLWTTAEKHLRLTLYYADRIEKYITREQFNNGVSTLKETSFAEYESETEQPISINPYGVIPMFKFETHPVLTDCIPIQDALNKTICDKLIAMEFAAYPQRYATGLEPPINELTNLPELPFQSGSDRLWFTNDPAVNFGEFSTANLLQYIAIADSYRLEMARVSGTPLHFFSINTGNAVSGEALKTLESRFTKRVKRLCLNFGSVWARAMGFALQIENSATRDAAKQLATQWDAVEQRSENEQLDAGLKKKELGVPLDVVLEELGYTSEDLQRFATLNKEAAIVAPIADVIAVAE